MTYQNLSLEYYRNETLDNLNQGFYGYLLWCIFGTLGIVMNVSIIVVINKTKTLRTLSGICMGNLAISDLLLCGYFTVQGIRYATHSIPFVISAMDCWTTRIFPAMSIILANRILCFCIAIERCVAVVHPVWFHNQRNIRGVMSYNILPYFIAVVFCAGSVVTVDRNATTTWCEFSSVTSKLYVRVFGAFGMTMMTTTVALYSVIMLTVGKKLFKLRKNANARKEYEQLIEFRVIKSLGIIMIVYVITIVMSTATNQIMLQHGVKMAAVIPFTSLLWVLNSAINLIIYFVTNETFRNGFNRLTRRQNKIKTIQLETIGFQLKTRMRNQFSP